MWTKGQIIREAFAEIGMGAFAYSLQPEDMQDALRRMNLMLAEWAADGIDLGYTVVDTPDEDTFSDDSEIATEYVRGVILSLAVEIAPNFGKQVSAQTLRAANSGRKLARRGTAVIPSRQLNTAAVPAGAGHKYDPRIITLPEAE